WPGLSRPSTFFAARYRQDGGGRGKTGGDGIFLFWGVLPAGKNSGGGRPAGWACRRLHRLKLAQAAQFPPPERAGGSPPPCSGHPSFQSSTELSALAAAPS